MDVDLYLDTGGTVSVAVTQVVQVAPMKKTKMRLIRTLPKSFVHKTCSFCGRKRTPEDEGKVVYITSDLPPYRTICSQCVKEGRRIMQNGKA